MPTPSQQPTTGSKLGVLPAIILGIGAFIGLIFLVAAFRGGIGNFIGCILMGVGAFAVFFILAMMLSDHLRGNQQLSAGGAMRVFLVPILLFIVGLVFVPRAQSNSDSVTTITSTVTTQVSTTVVTTTSRTHTPSSTTTKPSTTKTSTTSPSTTRPSTTKAFTSKTSTSATTSEPVETGQHGFLYQEPKTEAPEPAPAPAEVQPAQVRDPAPVYVHYRNCREARAAGAAPIYRDDPGYAAHLDRDGDGIACER